MRQVFNVYCDESGHLENDGLPVMVLGALRCPFTRRREIAEDLQALRVRHGLSPHLEIKWGKVSPAKQAFYLGAIDYFFEDPDLTFRAVVVPDKSVLQHDRFRQDHDTWYYKMYWLTLRDILHPADDNRVYLDIKDTRSADKVSRLQAELARYLHDRYQTAVTRIQTVASHEVAHIQLADLLCGVVAYANRDLQTSAAKLALVARARAQSGLTLTRSTNRNASKVNLLIWNMPSV